MPDFRAVGFHIDYKLEADNTTKSVTLYFNGARSFTGFKSHLSGVVKIVRPTGYYFRVHGCFVKAFNSAKDIVISDLIKKAKANPEYEVNIVGLGAGGVLAILAAEEFKYSFRKKANLVAFGVYRAFRGKDTCKYLQSICKQITIVNNYNDIFTYFYPWYRALNDTPRIGKSFSFLKLFNTQKYHYSYEDEAVYQGIEF